MNLRRPNFDVLRDERILIHWLGEIDTSVLEHRLQAATGLPFLRGNVSAAILVQQAEHVAAADRLWAAHVDIARVG